MKPLIIFLCGPHCSGKSSILRLLYEEGVLSTWGEEIGKNLFYQRRFDTEKQGKEFEFEVTEMELQRDAVFLNGHGIIGIETWHPGNLAYAMVRNTETFSDLLFRMKESPLISCTYGIRLYISPQTIADRTETFENNKMWAVDFYTKIDENLDFCIEQLGLQKRSIWINADQELATVITEVKQAIEYFKSQMISQ